MNFRKTVIVLLAATLFAGTLTSCKAKTDMEPKETEAQVILTNFSHRTGWKTRFNATMFELWESGDAVRFVYAGDGTGTDELSIAFYENRTPQEVLYDVTNDLDPMIPERYEGFFNADDGDWCYGRYIPAEKEPNGVERAYTAVEHNGGTLLIAEKSTPMDTEALQTAVDQGIMQIRENFEWTDHKPQEEFSYVVGTYVRNYSEEIEGKEEKFTETIVMNADHTGKLSFQDDVDMYWTSYEIVDESGNRVEYKVEGDFLYYDVTGDNREFERKK